MEKLVFHIDVNNAFLSWTAIDLLNHGYKYDIRNMYAVIGGDETKRSGIVLAKSTPSKKLGIITSETLYSARKKIPNILIFPPNYQFYKKMSKSLFNLLNEYTPDIEIASIDECYLDYGKVKMLYGNEIEFAKKIKKKIKEELGFTVNIGIAENKLCAKMASDFEKPDKIHTLYNYEIKEKMFPLNIGDLFGIGKKTVPKLNQIGIYKIGDLACYDIKKLKRYFNNQAQHMINIANGIDYSIVDNSIHVPKGIGHEITLIKDCNDINELKRQLFVLSEMVSLRLRKQNKYAKTICVFIKDNYFIKKSHQKKLLNGINTSTEIYKYAIISFMELYDNNIVRLIGIRLDDLIDDNVYQLSLFENSKLIENDKKLENTIDKINQKYGVNIIKKASLINK